MIELLRDPLVQFVVGAVLAAAALVATVIIYLLQRSRRGVTYDILSRTNLLTVREELEGKLQVLYEGEPAKSLSIFVLKVWNSGNQPILASDFERPISFSTGHESRLLTADVTEVEPRELLIGYDVSGGDLILQPTLLNPGDSVTFKLLVRDAGPRVWPDSRIVGVKALRRPEDGTKRFRVLTSVALIFMTLGFFIVFGQLPLERGNSHAFLTAAGGMFTASIGYFMMIYAVFKVRRLRLRLVRLVRSY